MDYIIGAAAAGDEILTAHSNGDVISWSLNSGAMAPPQELEAETIAWLPELDGIIFTRDDPSICVKGREASSQLETQDINARVVQIVGLGEGRFISLDEQGAMCQWATQPLSITRQVPSEVFVTAIARSPVTELVAVGDKTGGIRIAPTSSMFP